MRVGQAAGAPMDAVSVKLFNCDDMHTLDVKAAV